MTLDGKRLAGSLDEYRLAGLLISAANAACHCSNALSSCTAGRHSAAARPRPRGVAPVSDAHRRSTSPTSTAAPMAGAVWRRSSTATTARSSAGRLACTKELARLRRARSSHSPGEKNDSCQHSISATAKALPPWRVGGSVTVDYMDSTAAAFRSSVQRSRAVDCPWPVGESERRPEVTCRRGGDHMSSSVTECCPPANTRQ